MPRPKSGNEPCRTCGARTGSKFKGANCGACERQRRLALAKKHAMLPSKKFPGVDIDKVHRVWK